MNGSIGSTPCRLLLTGATGFIGGYLLREAISLGYEVWCAVRKESNRQHYQGLDIHLLDFDFSSVDAMKKALSSVPRREEEPPFHYIIHNAGVTKATRPELFRIANAEQTKLFLEAIAYFPPPTRFLLMSSMGSYGLNATSERMNATMPQKPHTEYGKSKLLAEQYTLASAFPTTIVQPTGVYGYGDKDYWITVRTMKKGWSFLSGLTPQQLSYVYVEDLVRAVFFLMGHADAVGKRYIVSDGKDYRDDEFTKICRRLLKRRIYTWRIPLPIIHCACLVGDWYGRITHRPIALNRDKYPIIKQRNWLCDITPLRSLGFVPKYDLNAGLEETFRKAGLLD